MTGEYFTSRLGPSVTEYSLAVATIYRGVKHKISDEEFSDVIRHTKTAAIRDNHTISDAMVLSYMAPTGTVHIRLAIGEFPTDADRAKTAEIGTAWLLLMHSVHKEEA